MASRSSRRQDRWYQYMITISPCALKKDISPKILLEAVHLLKLKLPHLITESHNFELGRKYGQLHIHLMGISPTMVSYRDNCRLTISGHNLFVKWVYGKSKGLRDYCNKESDCIRQSQVLAEHYYNHNYGFIDTL